MGPAPSSNHRPHGRRRRQTAVALLVVAACGGGVPPSDPAAIVTDPEMASRIDAVAELAFDELSMAGMSVAVAHGDEIVFASGYGYADLGSRIPARADTVFRLGSIGKSFTSAALLELEESGLLSLDDSLTQHVSGYPASFDAIAVRKLLSHTSGLTDDAIADELESKGGVGSTLSDMFELIGSQPPSFAPGAGWSYSNSGYMLAGEVMASVGGTSYSDVLHSSILDPLGLTDTTVCPDTRPDDERWASGYEVSDGNWERAMRLGRRPSLVSAPPINMDVVYAAGNLCSSVTDLVRWPHLLQTELLSPASFQMMSQPAVLNDGTPVGYGLGLALRAFGERRALTHGGVINGFATLVATFPDDNTTVAILVNTRLSDADSQELARHLLGAVFDEPPAPWTNPYETEFTNV